MPKVQFSTDNKKASTAQFPKLKLKNGELARLLILEEPEVSFVHTLQAPVIEGGVPAYETKERKDKTEYQTEKLEFVAKTLCQGEYEILDEKGSDPDHCPMCKAAAAGYGKPPQRRFAMNVIRYRTKAGSKNVTTPFSVDVVTWEFGDRLFSDIVDLAADWEEDGGLKKHDIVLGPCTNETFQKADLNVLPTAAFLTDADTRKLTIETFKQNRIDDLELAMGAKKDAIYVASDVKRVIDAWRAVKGYSADAPTAPKRTLDEGLDDLLDAAPKPQAKAAQSIDDLFDTDDDGWAKEGPEDKALRAEELPEVTLSEDDTFTADATSDDELDDLLAGL